MGYAVGGALFWGIWALLICAVRPKSFLSSEALDRTDEPEIPAEPDPGRAVRQKPSKSRELQGKTKHIDRLIILFILIATILLCVLPMSLNPLWNGEFPEWRNQYEVLAESILDGRINLDYGDMDPRLLELENPYDPGARADIPFHWDHAFYNGQYYMYFGVVPVFLLFLPYRIITGTSLTTYHATQIFTAFFIFGVFSLFALFVKKFFRKMPLSVYLSLSAAVSIMSVWFIAVNPALYCTAISAGICMEVWSLFFFAKAVWDSGGKRQICMGVLGSLFGALAFGCRPTIALANILAVPMFVYFLKGKRFDLRLLRQILIVIAPYVVIGALLMVYNYVRFENPFEFGQSYQLTVADQSGYGSLLSQFSFTKVISGLAENYVAYAPLQKSFPFFSDYNSVFVNFPISLVAVLCLLQKKSLSALKKNQLIAFTVVLAACPILITISQILASPYLLERYRSDIYWLIGIFMFLSFGHFLEELDERPRRIWGFVISILSFATIFSSFLLWSIPLEASFTFFFPEYLTIFEKILRFGL